MKNLVKFSVGALALAVSLTANATAIYSGTSGNLAASAAFTISGNDLGVVLTNTATISPTASSSVLTGLFFNLGSAGLTAVSAMVSPGAIVQSSECNPANCATETNVGGEFSYYFGSNLHSIASSGYLIGNTNLGNFVGANLDNPNALNGINFGIVSANFTDYSGNGGLDNDPLIKNSVAFMLSGLAGGLKEIDIKNVVFQYGTSLTEPNFNGSCTTNCGGGGGGGGQVPEPGSLALLGLGLLGLAAARRKSAAV